MNDKNSDSENLITVSELREQNYEAPFEDEQSAAARQLLAEIQLKMLESEFKEGNKRALTDAIYECASSRSVMPKWVVFAIQDALTSVSGFQSKSWDDVFGKPHPKGTNLNAQRKKIKFNWAIYESVKLSHKPVDASLFEEIGKKFGLGKTLTEEIYYSNKEQNDRVVDILGDEAFNMPRVIPDPDNPEKT